MLSYNYYGHACCQIDDGKDKILIDPYFTGNPAASVKESEVDATYVLVTHAHGDHIGDVVSVVVRTDATAITIPEILDLAGDGAKTIGMNLGGTVKTSFGFVRMVPALHSSGVPGGVACGYVINVGGKNIYFAGDTALFGDMKLIGERDKIDYAILPIGGHYTMDPVDAAKAVEFLGAENVIPIHYNTWDIIKQDPEEFAKLVKNAKVHIVKPGESIELI
ncbi:MAG: metal-dependent hydrolase [Selenomonadaceae bacterium]|nr:metal-dependent hydrolase [Selenomonadaceae bacterium]